MKVTVDLSVCSGYGNCVIEAPEVFDLDEKTGLCVVLQETPGEDQRARVESAVQSCPIQALALEG